MITTTFLGCDEVIAELNESIRGTLKGASFPSKWKGKLALNLDSVRSAQCDSRLS